MDDVPRNGVLLGLGCYNIRGTGVFLFGLDTEDVPEEIGIVSLRLCNVSVSKRASREGFG